jgi:ADP-ribosyl-[dinitrogen reductase] hydrolase
MIDKNKVRGAFLGIAIGDALGKPVETFSAEKIKSLYGKIDQYFPCSEHKWFGNDKEGTWTDDTQLSLAMANALINKRQFDVDEIAQEHVKEFQVSVKGWGNTTKQAISNIASGTHWSKACVIGESSKGVGNGVAMKVAPISVYVALTNPSCEFLKLKKDLEKIIQVSMMTHRTSVGITSGLAHVFAVWKCLNSTPDNFDHNSFIRIVCGAGMIGRRQLPDTIGVDDISNRFNMLHDYKVVTTEEIISKFGGGSSYVYDSLPFTYMFFLRNPQTIQSLYDCVSAGGDTDSNGSMLACMLGALHGTDIFPSNLIDGLDQKEMILDIADKLYDTFSKQN